MHPIFHLHSSISIRLSLIIVNVIIEQIFRDALAPYFDASKHKIGFQPVRSQSNDSCKLHLVSSLTRGFVKQLIRCFFQDKPKIFPDSINVDRCIILLLNRFHSFSQRIFQSRLHVQKFIFFLFHFDDFQAPLNFLITHEKERRCSNGLKFRT